MELSEGELTLNIMKKTGLTLFGIALFMAGSAYTRRQAEFIAHQKQTVASVDKAAEISQVRPQLKNTVTYHLVSRR